MYKLQNRVSVASHQPPTQFDKKKKNRIVEMLEISGLILLNEKYYSDKPPTVCVHNKDRLRNLQEIILNCSKLSSSG